MAPTSLHEGPTLRSTKAVAMPTCALHHDAGAPPCPSCETPHARTCAPWVGVETHEYDCVCPLCREAWLLSDTDAEELFGVAMRSGSEEWEPNWSEEVLARGATSQEILDEWRPECWFREDQQERARKPSSHTLPPTRSDPAAPHRSPRSLAGGGARRGARGGSRAGTPRPHLPPSVAASVCSARSRCMNTARTAPTSRPLHAHVQARLAARPSARPHTRANPRARPLHAHCTHLARTGTAHTTGPTRRGDSRRGARGDGTDDTDQEEGRTARGPAC